MDIPTICNLALQGIGTRTTVTQAELTAQSTNEAIQFNLVYAQTRDELLRMAPWDCSAGVIDLQYITSLPGTPENQSQAPSQIQWTPGLPMPPWTYEYAYPVDCLRALRIIPQFNSGITGVPIYPSSTPVGYSPIWEGPPVKFRIATDQFYPVISAAVVSAGSGYNVGDTILLALGANTSAPIGIPAELEVMSIDVGGTILSVQPVNSIYGEDTLQSGGYYSQLSATQNQGSTSGSGTGATFLLGYGPLGSQRVILTNQEYGVLEYCRQITDPNVMDSLFLKAWIAVLSAKLAMVLTGDKQLANQKIQIANQTIAEARAVDGNEGLTINDVTPDFLRARGIIYSDYWTGSTGFDWGGMFQTY